MWQAMWFKMFYAFTFDIIQCPGCNFHVILQMQSWMVRQITSKQARIKVGDATVIKLPMRSFEMTLRMFWKLCSVLKVWTIISKLQFLNCECNYGAQHLGME